MIAIGIAIANVISIRIIAVEAITLTKIAAAEEAAKTKTSHKITTKKGGKDVNAKDKVVGANGDPKLRLTSPPFWLLPLKKVLMPTHLPLAEVVRQPSNLLSNNSIHQHRKLPETPLQINLNPS